MQSTMKYILKLKLQLLYKYAGHPYLKDPVYSVTVHLTAVRTVHLFIFTILCHFRIYFIVLCIQSYSTNKLELAPNQPVKRASLNRVNTFNIITRFPISKSRHFLQKRLPHFSQPTFLSIHMFVIIE